MWYWKLCQDAVNLVEINRDAGGDAVLVLPNYDVIPNPIVHTVIEQMTNTMSSLANLFVYSNAATLLSSDLSNTGLENLSLYYNRRRPHSEFYSNVFIKWYSLLHERHLSSISVLSNYLITLFISKPSIEQEGHDGPGSLTWVSLEPNYFKICPPV